MVRVRIVQLSDGGDSNYDRINGLTYVGEFDDSINASIKLAKQAILNPHNLLKEVDKPSEDWRIAYVGIDSCSTIFCPTTYYEIMEKGFDMSRAQNLPGTIVPDEYGFMTRYDHYDDSMDSGYEREVEVAAKYTDKLKEYKDAYIDARNRLGRRTGLLDI